MPKAFMITHRRYLPTPPPTTTTLPSSDNNQDHHATATTEEVQMQALRLPLLPYFEQEQVEAVDLVVHKDNNNHHNHHHHHHPPHHHPQHHKWTGHVIHRFFSFDSGATSNAVNSIGNNSNYYSNCLSSTGEVVNSSTSSSSGMTFPSNSLYNSDVRYSSSSDTSADDKNSRDDCCMNIVNHNNETGIDLSMKGGDQQRYQAAPLHRPPAAEAEMQDKSGLSDGDSDSGCSTQNEGRGHLPPEVEYGWAECHAHFSLLYDLMTQSARKSTGGKETSEAGGGYLGNKDSPAEQIPFDYSKTSPAREVQEAPVLYELMAESPRKASGRDVPEHALEVEVPMQPYHPQQQQQNQEGQRLTVLEMPSETVGVRYEARRSLNDLLYAAGLPPSSPSPPSPSSVPSPSSSPSSSSEEAHTCEDCGKRYSTSSNLARHRQTHRSHGDKKARKCPHCEKVYVSMPAFSMHVRTHNQGCACPHCGKRFSRPWLLQGHIRTHTGEKPFACPQCGKSFADKSNLRAHIQTHSSEKPYMCGRCGKAFALKSYLYKHEESSCMRGERFRPLRKVAPEY